jgi:hypothetical protein
MRTLGLALIVALLCPTSLWADRTLELTQMNLGIDPSHTPIVGWHVQIPGLFNPAFGPNIYSGTGTTLLTQITCIGSCSLEDTLKFNFVVSGLNIFLGSHGDSTVFFGGDLTLDVRPFKLENADKPHLVDIFGSLVGCGDPACNDPFFHLNVDLVGNAKLNFQVSPSGDVTLLSGFFLVPEPGTLILMTTGCALIFQRFRKYGKSAH